MVGVGGFSQDLFDRVEQYSVFGRTNVASGFTDLSSENFATLVIDPLDINCPAGGTLLISSISTVRLAVRY